MKHPPPWWLRLPIYIDWIGLSLFIIVPLVLLSHGEGGRWTGRFLSLGLGAVILISVDGFVGFGFRWAFLPRMGLAFLAAGWCAQTIRWRALRPEDWLLLIAGAHQTWIFFACLAAEIRLRLRARRRPGWDD